MLKKSLKKISVIKLGEILLKIQEGKSLQSIISNFSASEMKQIRNFLESEVQYLSGLRDKPPLSLADIKSNFEPTPDYFYKQDCREPLESCLNETCFTSNPVCFSRKIKLHIEILIKLLTPYLEKQ